MLLKTLAFIATLSLLADAQDAVHGEGAQGTTMGPVAFMWPADRPWSASYDNIGPCGSNAAPGNRTEFPLGSAGSVSFSIADESYSIALRIAYGNNPTSQSDFSQFHSTISHFEEGHQCYSVPPGPSSVVAGSNATIQLQYWGNDRGKDESFYACADITFVEAELFTTQIPCFNVTASEFTPAGVPTSTATTPSSTSNVGEAPAASSTVVVAGSSLSGGLTAAEKAGVAVSVIIGTALIASVAFFLIKRKKTALSDAETAPGMTKVASAHS